MKEVAMQVRCIHCKREQYAVAVSSISNGETGCAWCGKKSWRMTEEEYRKELRNEKEQ